MTDPLVVTLLLDERSQAAFDALRRRHFPPERNLLAAHVTLFHALPGDEVARVRDDLAAAAQAAAPYDVQVTGVRSLGRGVAYVLDSAELTAQRARLAQAWWTELTPQDRSGFSPHVTVQNKVAPDVARALLADLRAAFSPYAVRARGLQLWHYRGGPWEPAGRWPYVAGG